MESEKVMVSYKFTVEEKAWEKYNLLQMQEFEQRNAELIKIIKRIEKKYHERPTYNNYEQFFYMVSKLEWI